jgi:hypothetical protein
VVNRQIGRILQQNQRAAARFAITLEPDGCPAGFRLVVAHKASFDHWAALSEGAYHRTGGIFRGILDRACAVFERVARA